MTKAAVIQIKGNGGLEANLARCGELLQQAAQRGAQLAVLPENFAYYGCRNLVDAARAEQTCAGPARRFLADQARDLGLWLVGGTLPMAEADHPKPYATCLVVSPDGEEVARYQKIHLFDVDVAETGRSYRESDDYRPGNKPVLVPTPLGKIGLSVCYDLRFPELYRALLDQGAEILVAPAAFTAATGKAHWQLLLRARAVENLCFMLGANLCDRGHAKTPTWGGSAIVDPWGRVVAEMAADEGVAVAELNLGEQQSLRSAMPALSHRRL
jgi:nitrilase